jgi:NAD(P)H-dependent FMN reductase
MPPRILAFAGSARRDSFNKRLVRAAVRGAEAAGVACTCIDLRDYPMPLYDGDLEAESGPPEAAARLRQALLDHEGLLISSPEYNGSISPLLKNCIDWASRSPKATPDLSPYQGKVAALMAASPGPLGGLRGLRIARELLANIGVTVLPGQMTLRRAAEAFDSDGELADAGQRGQAEGLGRTLAEWLLRLHTG